MGQHRLTLPFWLVLLGASGIVGGEALCILGPLRYEHVIHVVCHAIMYGGMALTGLGAVLHWSTRNAP
jgi:hypothetical protein